jgi:hypothetical protein
VQGHLCVFGLLLVVVWLYPYDGDLSAALRRG